MAELIERLILYRILFPVLFHVSKITQVYFSFFLLRAKSKNINFFSFHGSSLILPFPPLFFCACCLATHFHRDVYSDLCLS